MRRISRDGPHAPLDTGAVILVETRPAAHGEAGRLPGAVNPPAEFAADPRAPLVADRDRTVVTYCSGPSSFRSTTAAVAFERLDHPAVRVYDCGRADLPRADLPRAGLPFAGAHTAARAV